ncbi:adenosylmethionine decarboxylase [Rhodobacterales bacterium HKCCE2091]|nr:adenosylmethionine decarboxylase [Rhodobacterales bacterium HKCCE2091]
MRRDCIGRGFPARLSPMSPPAPFGRHLLIEMTDAEGLDDPARIETALRDAARACGARVLAVESHRFSPQGVTAVALLAESHITIHTWPEHGYAAADVFLCGAADPLRAVPVLRAAFAAGRVETRLVERGMVGADGA